jgi:lipopolysaccharide biosynthesis regulator YciM
MAVGIGRRRRDWPKAATAAERLYLHADRRPADRVAGVVCEFAGHRCRVAERHGDLLAM